MQHGGRSGPFSNSEIKSERAGLALLAADDKIKRLPNKGRQVMFASDEFAHAVPAGGNISEQKSPPAAIQDYAAKLKVKPTTFSVKKSIPLWVGRDAPIHAVSVPGLGTGNDPTFGRGYVNAVNDTGGDPILDLEMPCTLLDYYRSRDCTLASLGPDLIVMQGFASKETDVVARWHLPN